MNVDQTADFAMSSVDCGGRMGDETLTPDVVSFRSEDLGEKITYVLCKCLPPSMSHLVMPPLWKICKPVTIVC